MRAMESVDAGVVMGAVEGETGCGEGAIRSIGQPLAFAVTGAALPLAGGSVICVVDSGPEVAGQLVRYVVEAGLTGCQLKPGVRQLVHCKSRHECRPYGPRAHNIRSGTLGIYAVRDKNLKSSQINESVRESMSGCPMKIIEIATPHQVLVCGSSRGS